MENAKDTSPAPKQELKIVERMYVNDLTLSIGENRNYSIQRKYVFRGKTGYTEWFRDRDIEDARELLRRYETWCESHPVSKPSDKAAQK